MKQATFVIYGLICPIKNSIVYVGMTSDIEQRIKCHSGAGGNRLSKVGKYLFEKVMHIFDEDGELIETRPLRAEEKQTSLLSISKTKEKKNAAGGGKEE